MKLSKCLKKNMTSCRGKLYVGTRKNRHNFTVCQCKCNKLLFERIYGKGYVFSQREFTLFVYIKNTFKNTLTWIWAVYQQLHYLWKSQVLCSQIGKLYRAKLCSLWIHFHTERKKREIPKFLLFLHCWFLCTDPPLSHSLFLWTGLAWLGPYWLRGLCRHSWTNIC